MSGPVYVRGDDDKAYLNPVMAGMVDNDLVEFFICFSDKEPPEIVIERIPNYRPHRGIQANKRWDWYMNAASTILRQLGFKAVNICRGLSCVRAFKGPKQVAETKDMRMEKAMSFFFDLVGPVPAQHIVRHEGVSNLADGWPEGVFLFTGDVAIFADEAEADEEAPDAPEDTSEE
ncbi:MAG: hypothetical protein GY906_12925 [bacterium]|nr:hypothetical protein [bacterium]